MTVSNLATACSKQGRFDDADLILGDIHNTFLRKIEAGAMDRMHPDFLAFLYAKAQNDTRRGLADQAESAYSELIPMRAETLGPDHPRTTDAQARLTELRGSRQKVSLGDTPKPFESRETATEIR